MKLSVETPNSPQYKAACLFEREFFQRTYQGLSNTLVNDYVVTIREDDIVIATASYCSGTSNQLLVTEAGAPHLFLQQDGTSLPRHLFVEYGGRTLDNKKIHRHDVLPLADVLNSAIVRIALLNSVALVTGIAGPTAPKIFGRIGVHMTRADADRANIERCFPDAWGAFFQEEERYIYTIAVHQQPDSLNTIRTALSNVPTLQWDESVETHLSLT